MVANEKGVFQTEIRWWARVSGRYGEGVSFGVRFWRLRCGKEEWTGFFFPSRGPSAIADGLVRRSLYMYEKRNKLLWELGKVHKPQLWGPQDAA